jgi:Na+-transporting methylmalonyl-CoA/oxaloacetate decarboxylase gamma subunit
MDVNVMIGQGLEVMGIGVAAVFVVLALFFVILKVMMKIWPAKEE